MSKHWGIAFLALLLIGPTLVQWAVTPAHTVWTGFDVGGIDYYTYLTKIDWGRQGHWTYENLQTPEITEAVPIYTFYLALGHLCRITGVTPAAMFHLARMVLVILALWILARSMNEEGFIGIYLAVMASGIGLGLFGPRPWARAEFYVQGHLYLGMLGFPHYLLTLIGILLCFESYRLTDEGKWGQVFGKSAIGANLIALNHPFLLLLVNVVILLHTVIYKRKAYLQAVLQASVISVSALPVIYVVGKAFLITPWLQTWRDQARTITVPLLVMFLSYGVVAMIACWGAIKARGNRGLWVIWTVSAFGLAYSGMLKNGMEFLFFISVPLGALAADPLTRWFAKGRWWVAPIGITLITLQAVLLCAGFWVFSLTPDDYIRTRYLPADYTEALIWLKDNSVASDIILAPIEVGNMLPYWSNRRPYIGHHSETLEFSSKARKAESFYLGKTSSSEALEWLTEQGIQWVVVDRLTPGEFKYALPDEVSWGNEELNYTFLEQVRSTTHLTIYRVRGGDAYAKGR